MQKILLLVFLIILPTIAQKPTDRMVPLMDRVVITDLRLDSDELVARQLAELTLNELWFLENAIYARAGKRFKNRLLKGFFKGMEWYRPQKGKYSLSALDSTNLNIISKYQDVQRQYFGTFLNRFYPEPLPLELWEMAAPEDSILSAIEVRRYLGENPRASNIFPIAKFDISAEVNGLIYARQSLTDSVKFDYVLFTLNQRAARKSRLVLGEVRFTGNRTVKVANLYKDLTITSAALLQPADDEKTIRHYQIKTDGKVRPVIKK